MKKIFYLIPFVIIACQGITEVGAQVKDTKAANTTTSTKASTSLKYYTFAAVNYSYTDYKGEKINKVLVSEVFTTKENMSEENRYRMLDEISDSPRIRIQKNSSIDKRETFTFDTYAQASEKRQEIIKTGIQ
ncbi:MAG: hypothetical protein WC756_13365 [Taibaiella sp.]|jgi:hypothetical protein